MRPVWIVIEEGEFGEDVSGVFETQEEAAEYAEQIAAQQEIRTRYTSFAVPYRLRDRSSTLNIEEGDAVSPRLPPHTAAIGQPHPRL